MSKNIDYAIRENHLTKEEGYYGQILPKNKLGTEDIIELMTRKGTTLTRTDLRASFTILREVLEESMADGNQINFADFMNLTFSIGGVFHSVDDSFTPGRHELKINASISKNFSLDVLRGASLEKKIVEGRVPIITAVEDLTSKMVNKVLTQGRLASVKGDNLRFAVDAEDEGIFFISEDKSKEVKIIFEGKPAMKEMMFIIPDLSSLGTKVYIEIRTRLESKSLRTTRFDKLLEVK